MRAEVNSAVEFLTGLLGKSKVPNINVDSSKVDDFSQSLHMVMCTHYQNHWFPEKPFKGSAYRCIRIVNQKMDPLIKEAGAQCGYSCKDLLRVYPSELTMWVDPEEVSYRIGEEGSIGVLFDASESSDNEGSSDSNSTSSQEFLPSSPVRSPMRTPPVGSPVRSTNTSPALPASSTPPAAMFQSQTDMFQSQDHLQQQQQYQYHQQHQVQQPTQDYFQAGCKNEWLRGGYLPSNMTNSQENHIPNFEYFSSAFVSS